MPTPTGRLQSIVQFVITIPTEEDNMKVCGQCGMEIDTRDGDNLCQACDDGKRPRKKGLSKKKREETLRSLGLTKVRGAMGGTYWE
jgi:hypothetical protein